MHRLGVYVHFPWCLAKCPYCDFVTYPRARDAIEHAHYADAVIAELDQRLSELGAAGSACSELPAFPKLSSIFFGGGTPSLWHPAELARVLDRVLAAFGAHAGDVEVTVECNPSSLDEDRARALVDAGVGRLSIGVQALDDRRLRLLGRLHDAAGAKRAIRGAIRAQVTRISADLIFAVGDERPEEAAADAQALGELGLRHVSAYALTIEPGTTFGRLARRGRLPLATDDSMVESFFAIEEALARFGLAHYEVSNYATVGEEARHNLGYWRGDEYLGLGCAAYGTLARTSAKSGPRCDAVRYRNPVDPDAYMAAALLGQLGTDDRARAAGVEVELLDAETRLRERIMLGLRIVEGVDLTEAGLAVGAEPWPPGRALAAQRLIERGRLCRDGDRLTVPRAGWIWVDDTAAALF